MEEMSKGTLTEDMLRAVAGTQRLETVTHLELVIDSAETPSVAGVWPSVPSLHTLVLNGSRLMSFRDLGVGLRNLHTLSLEYSGIEDLDGIGVLSELKELRLANNNVSDVTPLACHSHLQVLDLEQNRIGNVKELEIMGTISLLYSLNLNQNPLMSSLGKLPGGQGRGVVHRLIPQLQVLGGTSLSVLEIDIVDADALLRDTNALAWEGASGARTAWEEKNGENVTVPCAGRNGCLEKKEAAKTTLSPVLSNSPDRGRRRLKQRERNGGENVLKASPDRGIVHWDSDLTQGGCPAFSGKASSAIRRYKVGGDNDARQRLPSPQGVLDTLNLAKQMELGLQHRREQSKYNQHTARQNQLEDRVLEWQREISSESLPQGEQIIPPPYPSTNVSESSESSPQVRAVTDISLLGSTRNYLQHELEEGRTIDMRKCWSGTWASTSTDGELANAEKEEERGRGDGSVIGIRNDPNAGDFPLSSRPWTTGHVVGGSSGLTSPLSLPVPAKNEAGTVNNEKKVKGENLGTGVRKGGYLQQRRTQCRRPQTAVELGRRRHRGHSGALIVGEDGSTLSAGWLHVWESLQTAGLHETNVSQEAKSPPTSSRDYSPSVRSPITTSTSACPVTGRVQGRRVDFRSQRQTRQIVRTRSAGLRRGDSISNAVAAIQPSSGSSTEADDDEQCSVTSEENDNGRDEMKKRAAAFLNVKPRTPSDDRGAGPDSRNNAATRRPIMACGRPVEMAQSAHRDAQPEVHRREVPRAAGVEEGIIFSAKGAHRRTRKGNRGRTTASRRSLATMDDSSSSSSSSSSSEGGDTHRQKPKRPTKGGRVGVDGCKSGSSNVGNCGRGADVRGENNRIYDRGSGGSSVAATAGRSGAASRRVSSVHAASRMLGFDLRKSLAAINEWTQKATLVTVDGGQPDIYRAGKVARRPPSFGVVSVIDETVASPYTPSSRHPWSAAVDVSGTRNRNNSHRDHLIKKENSRQPNRETQRSGGRPRNTCGTKGSPSLEASGHHAFGGEDGSEDEEVLSIAAARAALGISRGQALAATSMTTARGRWRGDLRGGTTTVGEGGGVADKNAGDSRRRRSAREVSSDAKSLSSNTVEGLAVSMSDEALENMLRRQPRTVPELRTKDSFRYFFKGMQAERMSRLLRGAYDGTLPPGEVDLKVEKRLGLVGDMLAW
ncbi:unnamed protein product [Sphacelaria rigidula]